MQIAIGIAAVLTLLLVLRAVLTSGESPYASGTTGAAEGPPTEESIRDALARGRKIDAIKAYRMLHRVDLKTAKEAVERIAEQGLRAS